MISGGTWPRVSWASAQGNSYSGPVKETEAESRRGPLALASEPPPLLCTIRGHPRSCPTRSKDLVENAKCLFGGLAPRIALRVFIGLGNQGLSVAHVL